MKSCGESFFSGTYMRWSWMSGTMPRFWIDAVARRQVLRDRQLELGVVVVVVEHLHRALAERARADDRGAIEVLERAGDDLRGRGRAAVDEHGERRRRVAEAALGTPRLAVAPRDGGDDGAAVDEHVGELHGLLEQAARVAAQVEDPRRRALAAHLLHRVGDIARDALGELLDLDVADAVIEQLVLDLRDVDDVAHEVEAQQVRRRPCARPTA